MASLLAEAGRGLNSIAGARLADMSRVTREISLHAPDAESLLVAFLTELIFSQEQEGIGFQQFHLEATEHDVSGEMVGSKLLALSNPVKAATFHNLEIRHTVRGLEAEIVFDV